ncbi:MAG TPA: DUF1501 domain-containing protein [Bryobacteraceae bacterium]|nr:DUF1501 domain-containing protein [Bryobacteraceae bacterium]
MVARRVFLKNSALAMVGVGAAPDWLGRAAYGSEPGRRKKILVTVFQRGAADGLNVVVPYGDPGYYSLRPNIAIPRQNVIELDGMFGLHPSLKPLKPIFDARQLAIVEAVGSPDPTRSHFDAQDYMESGTPGRKATSDGWLNRALLPAKGCASPVRAVGLGTNLPRMLRGKNAAVAVSNLNEFQIKDAYSSNTFEGMYSQTLDKVLNGTGRETFDAVKILQGIQKQPYRPAGGAQYPGGRFGQSMQQIARLIKADVGVEVAFADMGGWDTHVNEVGVTQTVGPLANLLNEFGQGIAAFYQDLGDRMQDVVLVTMSEFGRTARENGNRGTDHGHANLMFVMGGGVRGGKVYGEWPGLAQEQLYEGCDLNLTTDFRDVLGELVTQHLGASDVTRVFPEYSQPKYRGLLASA